MTDDHIREIAYALWVARGRQHGSAEKDWFAARSLVNSILHTQSKSPSEFFHCFTRSRNIEDAFATLKSILKIGLLLTPEQLRFYPTPTTTQCRLSLAYIPPHDLFRHQEAFGPFALRLKPYAKLAQELGASPVWYLPSFIKPETGEAFSEYGHELASGLASTQEWIHEMRNDPSRESQRHEPHRITRLVMRLIYPTHYKNLTDLDTFYFLQREWRIIRRDSKLDKSCLLTPDEKNALRRQNPGFFKAQVKVWSEEEKSMVDRDRVEMTYKLSLPFADVVSEIIVPWAEVQRVEALSPGVPVVASEQYEFGFHH